MTVIAGQALAPPMAMYAESRQIRFDDADGAYLAMAAIRRYLDGTVVSDVFLVPTDHGPALELPASAVSLNLIKSVVRRFGGHIGKAGPDTLPNTTRIPSSWPTELPRAVATSGQTSGGLAPAPPTHAEITGSASPR